MPQLVINETAPRAYSGMDNNIRAQYPLPGGNATSPGQVGRVEMLRAGPRHPMA